jgi:hypothetical protein
VESVRVAHLVDGLSRSLLEEHSGKRVRSFSGFTISSERDERLLALAIILAITSLPVAAQDRNLTKKHPVETFFMAGISSFNAHRLDDFMKQFAPDIEMYTPTGWLRGEQSVRARFAQTFQQFPSVRMEIENLKVREVARGTVVTDFQWRVYPMGQGPAFHGVGSGVYILRKGKWVEVLEHETVVKVDEGLNPAKK